jgi:hypothetical protein
LAAQSVFNYDRNIKMVLPPKIYLVDWGNGKLWPSLIFAGNVGERIEVDVNEAATLPFICSLVVLADKRSYRSFNALSFPGESDRLIV